jgi:hypothetical protein
MHRPGKLPVISFFSEQPPSDVIEACLVVDMSPKEAVVDQAYWKVLHKQLSEISLEQAVFLALIFDHDRSTAEVFTYQDILGRIGVNLLHMIQQMVGIDVYKYAHGENQIELFSIKLRIKNGAIERILDREFRGELSKCGITYLDD